jgi:hypothetical protein
LPPRIGPVTANLMRLKVDDEVRALRKHLLKVCG